MRLYEFAPDATKDPSDPLIPKLIAVSEQLKSDIEEGGNKHITTDKETGEKKMNLEDFIKYLQAYDITVGTPNLYDMIKNPPLKNLISNINTKDDQVIFKGHGGGDKLEQPEDESKKIVQQMAKSAL